MALRSPTATILPQCLVPTRLLTELEPKPQPLHEEHFCPVRFLRYKSNLPSSHSGHSTLSVCLLQSFSQRKSASTEDRALESIKVRMGDSLPKHRRLNTLTVPCVYAIETEPSLLPARYVIVHYPRFSSQRLLTCPVLSLTTPISRLILCHT
jgi:hypothetical protein